MPSAKELRQELLISQYISSLEKLDEMSVRPHIYPIAGSFAVGEPNENGLVAWRPRRTITEPGQLDKLYARLPAKFPPLFEYLLLNFRWAEVDLRTYTLMANPSGPDLEGFFREISRDPGLWEALIPAGFMRFAKGPSMDYDPVCFDMNSRKKNREMRVVKIDHEEILCNRRIKVVDELASSFEHLVLETIEKASNSRFP